MAEGLAVDWGKFVVGVRQDITYDLFKEGVISDADGKVILNLMQQDTKALRVVFRVGFNVAQPLTRLASVYPARGITPAEDAAPLLSGQARVPEGEAPDDPADFSRRLAREHEKALGA